MTRWKVWLGLATLFLAGTLVGVGGTLLYHQYQRQQRWERGPAARQERVMAQLRRELSLTSAQQAAVAPVVRRIHLDLLRLRFEHQPEIERILAVGIAEIKTTLTAEQQAELDKLTAQLRRRWQVSRDYLQAAENRSRTPE